MWILPLLILLTSMMLSIPLRQYLARVLDGRLAIPSWLRWFEQRVDPGRRTGSSMPSR